jgi:hypothetical protein
VLGLSPTAYGKVSIRYQLLVGIPLPDLGVLIIRKMQTSWLQNSIFLPPVELSSRDSDSLTDLCFNTDGIVLTNRNDKRTVPTLFSSPRFLMARLEVQEPWPVACCTIYNTSHPFSMGVATIPSVPKSMDRGGSQARFLGVIREHVSFRRNTVI